MTTPYLPERGEPALLWRTSATEERRSEDTRWMPVVNGPEQAGSGAGERLRRWRLVLGGGEADGTGAGLGGDDAGRDSVLDALYGDGGGDGMPRPAGRGGGGLGRSSPRVARWLG